MEEWFTEDLRIVLQAMVDCAKCSQELLAFALLRSAFM